MIFALAVFAFIHAQVALSLQFKSQSIEQCSPLTFFIQARQHSAAALATTLTILPFASAPVIIPIPNPRATVNGRVFSAILPLAAGTRFIAVLEDSDGAPVLPVSDVMTILPASSSPAPTECLHDASDPGGKLRRFALLDRAFAQCGEFTLSFNATASGEAPAIRAYSPGGFSLALNQTSVDAFRGLATYQMAVAQGTEVVLLIDGGNGIRETSGRIKVTGGSSSADDCLAMQREAEADSAAASAFSPSQASHKAAIVGSAVGGGVAVLLILGVCLWLVLERQKRHRNHGAPFQASHMVRQTRPDIEKRPVPIPTFAFPPAPPPKDNGAPSTLFAPERAMHPDLSQAPKGNGSRLPAHPSRQQRAPTARYGSTSAASAFSESRDVAPRPADNPDRLSIDSADIESMLTMANLLVDDNSRGSRGRLLGADIAAPPAARGASGSALDGRTADNDRASAHSRGSVKPSGASGKSVGQESARANKRGSAWTTKYWRTTPTQSAVGIVR